MFTDIVFLGDDVSTGQQGSLLDVAVGEIPRGVARRHDAILDVQGKGLTPHDGVLVCDEDDSPEVGLSCIHSLEDGRFLRDEFSQAGWSVTEVVGETFEVV